MSFGAVHSFHTEYVLDEVEFETLSRHTNSHARNGFCVQTLSEHVATVFAALERLNDRLMLATFEDEDHEMLEQDRAVLVKMLQDYQRDILSDPALSGMPACFYQKKLVSLGSKRRARSLAHERMHAYITRAARSWKLGRQATVALGLYQLGALVPDDMQVFGGSVWVHPKSRGANGAEEFLARIAELEACYEAQDGSVEDLRADLQAAVDFYNKRIKPHIDDAPVVTVEDFFRLYRRIKANWGSVYAFIDSFDTA